MMIDGRLLMVITFLSFTMQVNWETQAFCNMDAAMNLCPMRMSSGTEARWIKRSCTKVGARTEWRLIVGERARRTMVPNVEFGHVSKGTCGKLNSVTPAARWVDMAVLLMLNAELAEVL